MALRCPNNILRKMLLEYQILSIRDWTCGSVGFSGNILTSANRLKNIWVNIFLCELFGHQLKVASFYSNELYHGFNRFTHCMI